MRKIEYSQQTPYTRLIKLMQDRGITKAEIAELLGVSYQTVQNKFAGIKNGGTDFTLSDVQRIVKALDIEPDKIPYYFFGK